MSLFEALLRCLGTAHAHFLEVRVALVCLFNHVLITTTYRVVPPVFLVPQAFSDLATLNYGHISLHFTSRHALSGSPPPPPAACQDRHFRTTSHCILTFFRGSVGPTMRSLSR